MTLAERSGGEQAGPAVSGMPGNNTRTLLRVWLPVLIWVALIGVESTDWLSAGNTGELLYWIVRQFAGPINRHPVQVIHDMLRELGHFFGYGILSVLVFRALRQTFFAVSVVLTWVPVALSATLLVAASDEWHQSLLSSRQGRARDVLLDMCGAAVVLAGFLLLEQLRKRHGRQHGTAHE